jgi:hypothetical protein
MQLKEHIFWSQIWIILILYKQVENHCHRAGVCRLFTGVPLNEI